MIETLLIAQKIIGGKMRRKRQVMKAITDSVNEPNVECYGYVWGLDLDSALCYLCGKRVYLWGVGIHRPLKAFLRERDTKQTNRRSINLHYACIMGRVVDALDRERNFFGRKR